MDNPVHTPEQLALVLRGLRQSRRQTQAEAAQAVGLQTKTVSGLETRPATATLNSLFRLLAALDLELVIRPRGRSESPPTEW